MGNRAVDVNEFLPDRVLIADSSERENFVFAEGNVLELEFAVR
jgi:hypothetical protein